jgi:hypothetical protein
MTKKLLISVFLAYLLSGCQLFEPLGESSSSNLQDSGQTSKSVTFEDENASKRAVVTANCQYNDTVAFRYFASSHDAETKYWSKTSNLLSEPGSGKALKPFWDLRYVNSGELLVKDAKKLDFANHSIYTGLDAREGDKNIEAGVDSAQAFADASVVQAKCIDGTLAGGSLLNLLDSTKTTITYGGPHSTFMYRIKDSTSILPWQGDHKGNLLIQGNFDHPIYAKYSNNLGGNVNIGLYLQNQKNGMQMNYIITLYAAGGAWSQEQQDLKYDPTTKIAHIATTVATGNRWSTKSPKSKSTQHIESDTSATQERLNQWDDFYRVNISYQDLMNVLEELKNNPPKELIGSDFGTNPADWKLKSIYLQYELEESGGDALLAGSFKGFEAYTTTLPR